MGKTKNKPRADSEELSSLARALLVAMAAAPDRLEYNTMVLGGAFEDPDVERLDEAYKELASAGLAEKTTTSISFFGVPKVLYQISEAGKVLATRTAA